MGEKPLWEGRLTGGMDPEFARMNASIDMDRRLWREDVATNRASLKALRKAGLISDQEYETLQKAIDDVARAFEGDQVVVRPELEDIHMHVEAELKERAGELAGKIHTGRSRNDQIATDLRLFVKHAAAQIRTALKRLVETIANRAEETIDVVLPAYTHLQRAQPVLMAHWFLAYGEMALRDMARFSFACEQADASPLGLGACTGNPFGLDRELLRRELGFQRLCRNSLDGVSDRDFILDFCYAAACLFLHLSRLSEDLIIWSSAEFGFVDLAEELSTGSSMMPQKRNPDSAELIRGKTGRVLGNLFALASVLKGIPLTYNKDLQEDKGPLFDSTATVLTVLPIAEKILATLRVNRDRCRRALASGFVEATAVADYLTRKGVPFRSAYRLTGAIVADLAGEGRSFSDLSLKEWKAYAAEFDEDIHQAVTVEAMVAARNGIGGTAPEAIKREIDRLRRTIRSQQSHQTAGTGPGEEP